MSDAKYADFQSRLRAIDQNHKRAGVGFVRLEERDGLLVPVEKVRMHRGLPLRGIAVALTMFLVFKGFLLAYLGSVTYTGRVAALEDGSIVGKVSVWVMHADPVTQWIATQFSMLF
jgi:hypothetical protein